MTALTNNGILPTTLKDIYFQSGMAVSGENFILDLLYRLTLALMLFLTAGATVAGTQAETDKSVRSIVSGIVSYTRWPALSGQPNSVFTPHRTTRRHSAAKMGIVSYPTLLLSYVTIRKHWQPRATLYISGPNPQPNNLI
jgi:hypothetical protein